MSVLPMSWRQLLDNLGLLVSNIKCFKVNARHMPVYQNMCDNSNIQTRLCQFKRKNIYDKYNDKSSHYCRLSIGKMQGINKIKVMKRNAYDFRDEKYFKLRLGMHFIIVVLLKMLDEEKIVWGSKPQTHNQIMNSF